MESKDLIKVTSNITKASQCRDDSAMLNQANCNWEEYLTPVPMSISFLGELVFISAKHDFSINAGQPICGFQFIKYPDSFRACLMQVCNSGWRAFNEAHSSMDQIRLHTNNVPNCIKRAVDILLNDNDEIVEVLLPDQIENIDIISKSCVELATSVEKRFMDVIDLISELLETSTSAKQVYGRHLEDVRANMENEKLRKEALEEENRRNEELFNTVGNELQEAKKRFEKAMDVIPSAWDIIGMNFVEGFTNSVLSVLQGTSTVLFQKLNDSKNKTNDENEAGCPRNVIATNSVLSKSCMFLSHASSLVGFIENDQIIWSKISDEKTGNVKSDLIKNLFEELMLDINNIPQCPEKVSALMICEESIAICSQLSTLATEDNQKNNAKNQELIQKIQNIRKHAQMFDTGAKKETQTFAFQGIPPQMSKVQSATSGSASQIAVENAHFRVVQLQAQMKNASELYKASLKKMEEKKKGLCDVLIKMRNLDVEDIDFTTTIKILSEGLQVMGSLQEKWHKIVMFFQMVSNIIKTCLYTTLQDFNKTASKPQLKYDTRMFLKDMIYKLAFEASNIANQVNMIARTYTEISSKYLMDRVGSLGRIMALEPNDPNFKSERAMFSMSCTNAEDEIRMLVLKSKEDYIAKTKARVEQIENELKAVLPPQSEEASKELKAIVASGFQEIPNDTDQF